MQYFLCRDNWTVLAMIDANYAPPLKKRLEAHRQKQISAFWAISRPNRESPLFLIEAEKLLSGGNPLRLVIRLKLSKTSRAYKKLRRK